MSVSFLVFDVALTPSSVRTASERHDGTIVLNQPEFITLLRFETLDGAKIFAGKDYQTPVIPPECKKLLKHHSEKSRHYRIVQIN